MKKCTTATKMTFCNNESKRWSEILLLCHTGPSLSPKSCFFPFTCFTLTPVTQSSSLSHVSGFLKHFPSSQFRSLDRFNREISKFRTDPAAAFAAAGSCLFGDCSGWSFAPRQFSGGWRFETRWSSVWVLHGQMLPLLRAAHWDADRLGRF